MKNDFQDTVKKIMVLGAGRGQVDLIKAVKEYGYSAVVTSIKGNYPGFDLADEICYADISNPAEIAEAAERHGVSGIVTACLDTGITALGYTCEHNGLVGLSEEAAKLSGNKLLMKKAFMDNDVNTAKYKKVSSKEELTNVLDELGLPLIVKAVDLQGSRGINIVRCAEDLELAYERTMTETGENFCIVEEFIEGYEFGAQAFVKDNEVLFVLPSGDVTFTGNTKVPVGHYVPLELEEDIMEQIYQLSKNAIKAVGLNDCAVNLDMILKDDKVYIIELTGRMGANCLPQLISIYYGIDIYKMIVDTAMGINPKEYFENNKKEPTACYAKMLISDKSGKLKRIVNKNEDNPDITEITFFVDEGDEINKFTNSKDCVGQVVVKGETLEACEELIDEVISKISFELE